MLGSRVVFTAPGMVSIEDVVLPSLRPCDVLVRSKFSVISTGTELSYFVGTNQKLLDGVASYPYMPGQGNIGTVEAVGRDVEHVGPGDAVFCFGKHASHVIVDETAVFGVTDSHLSEALFCNVFCNAVTAVVPLPRIEGRLGGVVGLGVYGQAIVRVLCQLGAVVVASASSEFRRQYAPPGVATMSALSPSSVEFAIEATGDAERIIEAFEAVMPGGSVVLFGHPRQEVTIDLYRLVQRKGLTVIGTQLSMRDVQAVASAKQELSTSERVVLWVLERLGDGRLEGTSLVTDVIKPHELACMYQDLMPRDGRHLVVVIDWQ